MTVKSSSRSVSPLVNTTSVLPISRKDDSTIIGSQLEVYQEELEDIGEGKDDGEQSLTVASDTRSSTEFHPGDTPKLTTGPGPVLGSQPRLELEFESGPETGPGPSPGLLSGSSLALRIYMEKCLPTSSDMGGDRESSLDGLGGVCEWQAAQAASTPSLLPSLRFHDLVFGPELGAGSFGIVRYVKGRKWGIQGVGYGVSIS